MSNNVIPHEREPIVGKDGLINPTWRRYFQGTTNSSSSSSSSSTTGRRFLCDADAGPNTITLTPRDTVGSLTDGDLFEFVPLATSDTSAIVTITIANIGTKVLKAPDGKTFALWFDIQKDMWLTIRYSEASDVFCIQTPPLSFKQSIFGHGQCRLQASDSGASLISLTQEDGQGLLVLNPDTGAYRLIAVPTITEADVFAAQNHVNGVENAACASDTLYSVYVYNLSGDNDQDVALAFYTTSLGWNPTLNELGIYVRPLTAGSTSYDNTYTYVGMIWTGGGTTHTTLNGPALQSHCQSHFKLWQFPWRSDTVTQTASSASLTEKSTPSASVVTEGIDRTPVFILKATATGNTTGAVLSLRLKITGIAFDGSPFAATSETCRTTVAAGGSPMFLMVDFGVAVPMGVFTATPEIAVSAGTASFELTMSGNFAN